MLRALQRFEVRHWIDQGSLLGLAREGRFLAGDNDIDIGVWKASIRKVEREFADCLRACGLEVSRFKPDVIRIRKGGEKTLIHIAYYEPHGTSAGKTYYVLPRLGFSGSLFYAVLGAVIRRLERVQAPPPPSGPRPLAKLAVCCAEILLLLLSRLRYRMRRPVEARVPRHHFASLATWRLGPLLLPVPSDPHAYLEFKYGKDWRLPNARPWVYWRDEGGIVKRP